MLVLLDERGADDWMNPLERYPLSLKRLLVPAPAESLVASPASPLVNSVKNDRPELLVAHYGLNWNCRECFIAWYGEEDAEAETIDVQKCGLCGGDPFKKDNLRTRSCG